MDEAIDLALRKLSKVLKLKGLVLFGSRARGDWKPWSDYDLLIIADFKEDYMKRIPKILDLLSDIPAHLEPHPYTPEEAKELLSKGKHYTYVMQQVRAKEKELDAKLARIEQGSQEALTPEEQEIQEARATLKRYGVVTEDEVDAKLQEFQAKQARLSEFQMFRQAHPEVNDFAARMIEGAANAWGMTYEQAYQQGWGQAKQPQKVVKKKIVGASKRATTPVSNKDGAELTRADIAAMSTEEYKKRAAEIDQLVREGRLK